MQVVLGALALAFGGVAGTAFPRSPAGRTGFLGGWEACRLLAILYFCRLHRRENLAVP